MLNRITQNYANLVSYINPKKEGYNEMEVNSWTYFLAHVIAIVLMITIASVLTYFTLQLYDRSISFETVGTVLIAFYLSGIITMLILYSPLFLLLIFGLYLIKNMENMKNSHK
jgi:hypothetical protein